MVDVGAVVSVEAVAGDEIALQRRRLDVHVREQVRRRLLQPRVGLDASAPMKTSCSSSSPHDHWTVPAPNTSAPLACR